VEQDRLDPLLLGVSRKQRSQAKGVAHIERQLASLPPRFLNQAADRAVAAPWLVPLVREGKPGQNHIACAIGGRDADPGCALARKALQIIPAQACQKALGSCARWVWR